MKKLGDIIGDANAAAGASISKSTAAEAKPHRVSVCYMVFAEIQVVANDARQARAKALANVKSARRKFAGGPCDYRVEIIGGVDPHTGEPIWVEIDKPSR